LENCLHFRKAVSTRVEHINNHIVPFYIGIFSAVTATTTNFVVFTIAL
jgi:hypothetical protein